MPSACIKQAMNFFTDRKRGIALKADHQAIVNGIASPTCVLSVDRLPDGSYGNIRIIAGNKPYIASIENTYVPGAPKLTFEPGAPYERYLPKDLNFEEVCIRCAIGKEPIHNYVHPERFDIWFNIFMLPLESDDENTGYCTYTMEYTKQPDPALMSNRSADISNEVLNTCVKLHDSNDFERTMDEIMKDIRRISRARRCCIMLMDYENRKCSVLCEDSEDFDKRGRVADKLDDSFFDIADSWLDTIAGSDSIVAKNEHDMMFIKQRNPVWYESLKRFGVESVVLFPLKYNGEILGFIFATNFDTGNAARIKETFELTSFFIASEIANHQLLDRLEVMSKIDMLTGICNRNAMNDRVSQIVAGTDAGSKTMGVAFADLNGLKQTNDSEGHGAGDRLLINAAEVLKKVFPECELYRAGGDAFMIFAPDMSEDTFNSRVAKLKEISDSGEGVSFAVGDYFCPDSVDIRQAMRIADERMYEDKEKYYQRYPERRHK